ncbi:Uncharacterized protein APZ42_007719, partial [Daphnia magna]
IRELSNNSKTELKDVVVKHLRICSLHFKKEELKMSGTGRHYLLGNAVPTIFQSYEKSVGSNPPHRIPFQELNSNVAPGKNIDSIETIDDRSGLNWVSLTLKHVLLSQLILSRLKRKTDADECHITSTPRPVSQNTKHETSVEPESSLHTNNETENSQTRPTHVFENQVIQSKTNSNHESWAVADATTDADQVHTSSESHFHTSQRQSKKSSEANLIRKLRNTVSELQKKIQKLEKLVGPEALKLLQCDKRMAVAI